jgi:vesicle transport through interaction with t-SNAREs protein 1
MANPLDTDVGSEMFSSYEAELKLVQADLNQKLDQISEASGEERKAAIRQAERVLDEANELVCHSAHPLTAGILRPCN